MDERPSMHSEDLTVEEGAEGVTGGRHKKSVPHISTMKQAEEAGYHPTACTPEGTLMEKKGSPSITIPD